MSRAMATIIVWSAASLWASAGWAASCAAPSEPAAFPDPAKATEPEMVTAQQGVKQYLSAMESRLKCLEAAKEVDNYNEAVAHMQRVASKFNTVIRAYKSRQTLVAER